MKLRNYRRLWRYLDAGAKRLAAVALVFTVVSSLMEALGVGGLVLVMRLTEGPEVQASLPWLATFQAASGISDYKDFAIALSLSVAAFYFIKNAFLLLTSGLQTHLAARTRILVTGRLMTWYLNRPFVEHLREKPSEVVYLLSQSSEEGVIQGVVPGLVVVTETLAVCAILAVAIMFYPLATLVFIGVLAAIPGAIYTLYLHRQSRAIGVAGYNARQALHGALVQGLGSLREIRALEKESYFVEQLNRLMARCAHLRAVELIFLKVMPPMVECVVALVVVLAATLAISRAADVGTALPMVTLFGAASLRLLPSIFRVSQALQLLSVAREPLARVLEELGKADRWRPAPRQPKIDFQSLSLEHVGFRYPGSPENVVSDVCLTLCAGESVAIVGPSGAGKSTLVDLLLGILSPTEGYVLVNGEAQGDEGRRPICLSYIPQDIYLLNDTLRRNVAFGIGDADVDEARLRTCLRQACLNEVVQSLPEGVETVLGERGVRLSGGQRQRVALARALYHEADLLILDEATSALDTETEARISETLEELSERVSRVVITHRLSAALRCDRIYYIGDGRVLDHGTYSELFSRCEPFRRMVLLGQSGYEQTTQSGRA